MRGEARTTVDVTRLTSKVSERGARRSIEAGAIWSFPAECARNDLLLQSRGSASSRSTKRPRPEPEEAGSTASDPAAGDSERPPPVRRRVARPQKPYVPAPGTANYAFLIVMFEVRKAPGGVRAQNANATHVSSLCEPAVIVELAPSLRRFASPLSSHSALPVVLSGHKRDRTSSRADQGRDHGACREQRFVAQVHLRRRCVWQSRDGKKTPCSYREADHPAIPLQRALDLRAAIALLSRAPLMVHLLWPLFAAYLSIAFAPAHCYLFLTLVPSPDLLLAPRVCSFPAVWPPLRWVEQFQLAVG